MYKADINYIQQKQTLYDLFPSLVYVYACVIVAIWIPKSYHTYCTNKRFSTFLAYIICAEPVRDVRRLVYTQTNRKKHTHTLLIPRVATCLFSTINLLLPNESSI